MNSRQVEVFKVIMECGSITRAAAVLHVSQPAVTKSLKLLEHDLGLLLFTRTPKGLVPTSEARALYTEVERTFTGLTYLSQFAQGLRAMKHGRLVVSVIPALSARWLPIVAARFLADYPEASLSFRASSSPYTVQLVGQCHVDLGIAQSRFEDATIERTRIFGMEAVCVMPASHPLTVEDVITPAHLRGENFISLSRQDVIRAQLERLLEEAGVGITRRIDVAMGVTLFALVNEGVGIGVVDAETASYQSSPNVAIRPFRPLIEMPIYLLRARRKPASVVENKFAEYILGHAPKPPLFSISDP